MSGLRYKISAIILVLGILSLTTGVTYSLFTTSEVSEKTEIIRAGAVTLSLSENGELSLDHMYELSEEEGLMQKDYYEFSITNTGDADSNVILYLVDDTDKLASYTGNLLDKQYLRSAVEIDGTLDAPRNVFTGYNGVIANDTILMGETKNYKLRMWVNFTGLSEDMVRNLKDNQAFLKVKVIAEQKID